MKNTNIHKAGYKHTKSGWIPVEWDFLPLSSITTNFKSGEGITSEDISKDGEFPVYGGNGLRGYTSSYTHDGPYLLIGRQGALCGNIILTTGKVYVSEHAIAVSASKGNDIQWLGYLLDYFNLNRLSESSAQPGLAVNKLLKLKVPTPSQGEQNKMATILMIWDKAIQKTQQLIEQLKHRNKGLSQQLLTSKKRLKGFSGIWNNVLLEDVTTKISRRNGELVDAKVYSVTNSNGFVLQSEHFEREVAGADLSNYKIIKTNEFAYNPARINVGSIAYFTELVGIISSLYVCFKTKPTLLDMFLWYLLDLDLTKHRIISLGEGGVRVYLWYDLFGKIKIALPTIEEQEAIMKILVNADNELKLYEKQLTNLQEQKKGLMQKLLSGEVRVRI